MKKRSIVFVLLATLFTFGIYGIYWFIVITDEVARTCEQRGIKDRRCSSGILALIFTIVTFGIYALYWIYVLPNKVAKLAGDDNSSKGVLYLILELLGCGIISTLLLQNDINKVAE